MVTNGRGGWDPDGVGGEFLMFDLMTTFVNIYTMLSQDTLIVDIIRDVFSTFKHPLESID